MDADSQAFLARKYDPVTEDLITQMKAAGYNELEVVNVSWDEGSC